MKHSIRDGVREPGTSSAAQLPADIPLRRGTSATLGSEGLGAFQAFSLVLLLMLLGAWILRKWRSAQGGPRREPGQLKSGKWPAWLAGPARGNQVQVLESRQLTPKASLHLVRWDGKEWLVGCAEQGIQVIGQRAIELDGERTPPPQERA